MQDRSQLVFVEVRYRRSIKFGSPAETVDQRKQRKLIKAAQCYLCTLQLTATIACRFDIVGITPGTAPNTLHFNWIQDAFSAY
jgi:putative endonuclease